MSVVSKDLLLEHKAVAHGLTQRRKRDQKLKMKLGKKPKKLEMVDKKEVNENEKAENKDVDLDTVLLQVYTIPGYVQILSGEQMLCCYCLYNLDE